MNIKRLFIAIAVFATAILSAQAQFLGEVLSTDSATHTVIRIYPDSFPNVNVIFRAQGPNGQPMWDISTRNVNVYENGKPCNVISVEKLTNDQRVNTALVIDHSCSMKENPEFKRWSDSARAIPSNWKTMTWREYTNGRTDSDDSIRVCILPPCPEHIRPAIWHAKVAAQTYINGLDTTKDAVAVIGFADRVHEKVSLNTDFERDNNAVQVMRAEGGTAFYDGVFTGLDEISRGVGVKAVIALTDGEDNSSKHTLAEVIAHAQELGVPVYCVGLGDANRNVMIALAKQTGGAAYFTNDPTQLSSIYALISEQIMSVYELTYVSDGLLSVNTDRDVRLEFEIPQNLNSMAKLSGYVPAPVIARIEQHEDNVEEAKENLVIQQMPVNETTRVPAEEGDAPAEDSWPVTAGIVVALVATGAITARMLKKAPKQDPNQSNPFALVSVYPNPTIGPLTVTVSTDVSAMPGRVMVHDFSGKEVYTMPFVYGSAMDMNVAHLEKGIYLVSVQAGAHVTAAERIVVQ